MRPEETPFFLSIFPDEGDRMVTIDLDEADWAKTHASDLRVPGAWVLRSKHDGDAALSLIVRAGDQPFYTARHTGTIGPASTREVIAYGIGKKMPNGQVESVWILPSGEVCSGADVDDLSRRLVRILADVDGSH